jgi:glyceraldehyde 3-phosphate dehydrogenase
MPRAALLRGGRLNLGQIRLAINGFGRIGRQVTRIAHFNPNIEVVAVNDLGEARANAHLFKYDSSYGRFNGSVVVDGDCFIIDSPSGEASRIRVTSEKDPAKLNWAAQQIDFVLESTGVFTNVEECSKHISAGARFCVLSAPSKGEMPTYVLGVNHENWEREGLPKVVSNASCTTNCLAPMVKVLHDSFGVKRGIMNTIHSYTNDQRLLDRDHKDLRRARSAAVNIIPTTTGAAKAVALVIPELKGRLDGFALRVPTPTGSIVDFTCELEKPASKDEINAAMTAAAAAGLKGILSVATEPIVLSDIVGDPHSCIIDAELTTVIGGNLAKIVGWYDNEWGYSERCVDLMLYMQAAAARQSTAQAG